MVLALGRHGNDNPMVGNIGALSSIVIALCRDGAEEDAVFEGFLHVLCEAAACQDPTQDSVSMRMTCVMLCRICCRFRWRQSPRLLQQGSKRRGTSHTQSWILTLRTCSPESVSDEICSKKRQSKDAP